MYPHKACVVLCLAIWATAATAHAETIKIGNILALTGDGAAVGQHIQQAENLYMKLHGLELPAGLQIQLVTRDDGSKADAARRLAQELIVRDKVHMLAGIVMSPQASAIAPVITEAKVPTVIMNASTGSLTRNSPYLVRFSHSNWQMAYTLGQWLAKQGTKNAYTMVADYASGQDMEAAFRRGFTDHGGTIFASDRTPLNTTDFLPTMQRIKAARPQALFSFTIAGPMTIAMYKAYADAGMRNAGIALYGAGSTPDDELPQIGPAALGTMTAAVYAASLKNAANESFVKAWKAEYGADAIPSFESVAAWAAMDAIFAVVRKLGPDATGDAAMTAFKAYASEAMPQGPISIDPETRDIVQNVYMGRVEKDESGYVNKAFETIRDVKDPWKVLNPN